jgi:hypothetical protein
MTISTMHVGIGTEAAQFPENEYIHGIFHAVRQGREGGKRLPRAVFGPEQRRLKKSHELAESQPAINFAGFLRLNCPKMNRQPYGSKTVQE